MSEDKRPIPVSLQEYMVLAENYDKSGRELMLEKGKGYSVKDDFLSMENKIAGLTGEAPEFVSMILACKHIASLFVLLEKPDVLTLDKWDERIRDGTNLLKIASAFVHARRKNANSSRS